MAGRTFHDSKQMLFSYAHNTSMMLCHQMLPVSTFDIRVISQVGGYVAKGNILHGMRRHTYGYIPGRIPWYNNLGIFVLRRTLPRDSTTTIDDTTHPVLGTRYHTVFP